MVSPDYSTPHSTMMRMKKLGFLKACEEASIGDELAIKVLNMRKGGHDALAGYV